MHECTAGVPRLVNQLCDHALVLAAAGGHTQLDRQGILEAWSDLQHLPPPESTKKSPVDDLVEFGSLEDDFATEPDPVAVENVTETEVLSESESQSDEPLVSDFSQPDLGLPSQEPYDAESLSADGIESDDGLNEGSVDVEPNTTRLTADTGDRLDQIERQLESCDAIPFPGVGDDPFAEQFAEREIVIRRSGSMLNRIADRQPVVSSSYGQELLSTLGQVTFSHVDASSELPPVQPSVVCVEEAVNQPFAVVSEPGMDIDLDWVAPQEPAEPSIGEPPPFVDNVTDVEPRSQNLPPREPQEGIYQINVDFDSPPGDTDAASEFQVRTEAMESQEDLPEPNSTGSDERVADQAEGFPRSSAQPDESGVSEGSGVVAMQWGSGVADSSAAFDSHLDNVAGRERQQNLGLGQTPIAFTHNGPEEDRETATQVSNDGFAEPIHREIQANLPPVEPQQEPTPTTIRVVSIAGDDSDSTQPRRRFKQLFSNLSENRE